MHQIHHRNRIMDNFLKLPFLIQCRRPLPASSLLSSANNVCFPIFSVLQRDDVVSRTWHLPLISCVWFVDEIIFGCIAESRISRERVVWVGTIEYFVLSSLKIYLILKFVSKSL